jgi:hypothetical protein
MVTQDNITQAIQWLNSPTLTNRQCEAIAELILNLVADRDARFAELVESNRWQRIYREKLNAERKATTPKTTLPETPEARRAAMAKARAAAMSSGKVTQV